MVSTRHRSRSYTVVAGNATWHDGSFSTGSSYSVNEECDDVVGNFWPGVNYFKLSRSTTKFWTITGLGDVNGWRYNGFVQYGNPAGFLSPSKPEPNLDQMTLMGLAKANPNTPHVDVPVFLSELRDIPKLLRTYSEIGAKKFRDLRLKDAGNLYLSHEFGVKPFFSDIFRMMDFVNIEERKLRELRALQNAGTRGLGRSRVVWTDKSDGGTFTSYVSSLYSEGNQIEVKWSTRREKRVSSRWIPTEDVTSLSDEQLRHRANRIVYGLDVSFATLWEAMPWSWLIDWYGQVGDLVDTWRNTMPVIPEGVCAMQRMVTGIDTCRMISGPGLTTLRVKPNRELRVEKLRIPHTLSSNPDYSLPHLSGRQLSILSAIAVTRL